MAQAKIKQILFNLKKWKEVVIPLATGNYTKHR